jgi:nicotinamide-nucleotide amidase
MTAEIVSVGTELLLGQIVDTHAPKMAQILADCGIGCTRRQTVGDNLERLTESIKLALSRSDVVITIGGLGPTQDDITREGIAAALGVDLIADPDYEDHLRRLFAKRKFAWVDSNLRQALRPADAQFIPNDVGTATGLICRQGAKSVIALPGPRSEFNPMAEGPVRDYLEKSHGGRVIHSRILRVCGLGESYVEEQIRHLMQGDNPSVAPYAHPAEVHLRLTARAASRAEADRIIDPMEGQIRGVLGNAIYGVDDKSLEEAVIDLLSDQNKTVAVAESITGGGLGQRLTNVPGSGDAFRGGVITYDLDAKQTLLGVQAATLKQFGPVSEETAREMAANISERLNTDYGVSITGNAGPTADVDGKPVGLVYIGIAGPSGVAVKEQHMRGSRADIRYRCTQLALVHLRESLLSDG